MTDYLRQLRTGVVLSSGGVRGVYAHTGFLLALQHMGIKLQAITGCSAGAIVGGIYASGGSLQDWASKLVSLETRQFWAPSWLSFFASFLAKGKGYTGLSTTKSAMDFCQQQLKVKTFEDCPIPFYALAKNLASGNKTIFSQGALAPRMVASAAIPLLYEPVEIESEFYCDGALLELAPTDAICCKHKLDILIVHHVAQRSAGNAGLRRVMQRPWTLLTIISMLLYQQRPWYLSDQPLAYRHCPCGCGAIIVVIEPNLPDLLWPVTLGGGEVLNAARAQGNSLLMQYKDNLQQHDGSLSQLAEVISFQQLKGNKRCSTG